MTVRSGLSGWRVALRLAWREAWRAKGRSLLVLVMVTFPVIAVIAADVAQATSSVSSVEGLDRRIGSAQAEVTALPGVTHAYQAPDPDSAFGTTGGHGPAASLATVEQVLGQRPVQELRTRESVVRTRAGVLRVDATGVDMAGPVARGLFRLTSGRFPRTTDEVAVNAALAGEGFAVGDSLTLANGTSATVVGVAESAGERSNPVLLATPAFFPAAGHAGVRSWLVGGDAVTWDQVRALNRVGVIALSRQVVEHPPPRDQLPAQLGGMSDDSSATYTVLALVGVMALIEVVLLAGPAFAVGARRQSRSLALIAANGGTPTQSRRVVLGAAVVIGAVSAVTGIVLGITLGRLLVPVLQSRSDTWFGPFQVRWDHVLGIAAFGVVSAFLAAVVPARIASRQDVVAVLAGRRGDRRPSRRSPVIGLLLVAAGVATAVLGARRDAGETMIAGAAVLSVLGMVFLVPVVVVAVARLGRRFPLPLRYAVRDAARHRTRTVPAVAAVAATVAGVVALSIANTSDQAQAKAQYVEQLPVGTGLVTDDGRRPSFLDRSREALASVGLEATTVQGVVGGRGQRDATLRGAARRVYEGTMTVLGSDDVVADHLPPVLPEDISAAERDAADAVLAQGGVVLFSQHHASVDHAVVAARGRSAGGDARDRLTLPSYVVDTGRAYGPASMVLAPSAAHRLALRVTPVALLFDASGADPRTIDQLRQTIGGLDPTAGYVYVESGYQVPGSEQVVLWILFGLAAVLMLGGTLTATFLALSDARPDLATLSAVGASPRTRRAVAAAYAVSVGVVGAALGAAVGLVPGIAVTYPLTRPYDTGDPGPSHYLQIPWLEIVGLVVLLPLLTAVVVGLTTRSRLPLVARLD